VYKSKNVFYEHPDGYMVGITSKGEEFCFDKEDFHKVSKYTWALLQTKIGPYVITNDNKTRKRILLHRLIMNPPDGMIVDHINHNGVDNRKSELRICTNSENLANQKLRNVNSSGYKGVSWDKKSKKWKVYIRVDSKRIHLGFFSNIKEAARKYNEAAVFYFGEFALTNVV